MILQFKIQIKRITKPPVWRRITVPAHFSFLRLHDVIQMAFGWSSTHLFEFSDKEFMNGISISIPFDNEQSKEDFYNASKLKIKDIFSEVGQRFIYTYDFGDDWVHDIFLEDIIMNKDKKARCLGGRGACPPEDCGGVWGYERIKGVLRMAPTSEEAVEYRQWLNLSPYKEWDAKYFNLEAADKAVQSC